MTCSELIEAFSVFMNTARPFLIITNGVDYNLARKALDQTLEAAEDTLEDPLNQLIDMLAHSIARY